LSFAVDLLIDLFYERDQRSFITPAIVCNNGSIVKDVRIGYLDEADLSLRVRPQGTVKDEQYQKA
jgi:hypothetical protein